MPDLRIDRQVSHQPVNTLRTVISSIDDIRHTTTTLSLFSSLYETCVSVLAIVMV